MTPNNIRVAYFINQAGLHDLGYRGPAYTWSNKRSPQDLICERLDRALANTY